MRDLLKGLIIAALLVLGGAIHAPASAAEEPVQGSILLTAINEVEVQTVNEKGEKVITRIDAANAHVVPGDVVIYTIKFKNIGKEPAGNVAITDPIPSATLYIFGSAEGDGTAITFSVNGGETYDVPENLYVLDAEGKKVRAKPSDYTHIRWVLTTELAPEHEGEVSFKVIIR